MRCREYGDNESSHFTSLLASPRYNRCQSQPFSNVSCSNNSITVLTDRLAISYLFVFRPSLIPTISFSDRALIRSYQYSHGVILPNQLAYYRVLPVPVISLPRRIIIPADFGLSNAVRVSHATDGSTSEEYCVTQCGSPAYAAPELLGNKKYSHKVDIWSM